MATQYRTPGVYLQEPDSFPPSIVGVETAVPCFIGYTAKAEDRDGRSLTMLPKRIESMTEFVQFYGDRYPRTYRLADGSAPFQDRGAIVLGDGSSYRLAETGKAIFHLYDSMRLFYANGGGSCYVIAVDTWDSTGDAAMSADALLKAIDVSATFIGPTMLAIPDAVLLGPPDYAEVVAAMLAACGKTGDRMAILDIQVPDADWHAGVDKFRTAVRSAPPECFRFGAAYLPALVTAIVAADEIDVSSFDPDGLAALKAALTKVANALLAGTALVTVTGYIDRIGATVPNTTPVDPALPPDQRPMTHGMLTQALIATLPGFDRLVAAIAAAQGILPASGAIAGVWTTNDRDRGVWNAPANTGIAMLIEPLSPISDAEQDDLNVPADGLAINAIRSFQGRGTLIWGARTLDGLSSDWRYIQVRRTMIYVEQSVKQALEAMVFKPNTAQTWVTVTSVIESFLHGLWAAGGLMGDSAAQAYSVQAGLGSTMTPDDVLNGVMRVQIIVQMVHPAEFIQLSFKQQMLGGA